MAEHPSYMTSTTSQLLVAAVLVYGIGAVALIWKGVITNLEPLQWLINILLPLYAVRKGAESIANGNGKPPTP
jgi:hypothetical protein